MPSESASSRRNHASRVEAATRADEAKDSIKRERVVLGPWPVCTARPTGMRWHGQLVQQRCVNIKHCVPGVNCSALRSPGSCVEMQPMSHPNTAGCPVPEFPCYGHRFGVLPACQHQSARPPSTLASSSRRRLLGLRLLRLKRKWQLDKGTAQASRRGEHTLALRPRCAGRRVVQSKALHGCSKAWLL